MPGLLDKMGDDITITRKLANGTSVTVKSPKGAQTDMAGMLSGMLEGPVTTSSSNKGYQGGGLIGGPYVGPTADNVPINANPGEFVLNVPASQNPEFRPIIEEMNNWGRDQLDGMEPEGDLYAAPGSTDQSAMYAVDLAEKYGFPGTDAVYFALDKLAQEELAAGRDPMMVPLDVLEDITGYGPTQGQSYWTGGEVEGQASPGATPDEGDTFTTRGQTFYFKNGQWVYKGGSPAPEYATKDLADQLAPSEAMDDPATSGLVNVSPSRSPEGAKFKEQESKNAGWARRAIEAEKTIRQLASEGYNPANFARSKQELIAGLLGDSDILRDEEGQRYRRAVEAFVAAVLRKDTGAQIASSEYERVLTEMFPSLGSTDATQQQLANQRKQAIDSFIEASGPAKEGLTEQLGDLYQEAPVAEGADIVTGEDILGGLGGIGGAVAGGKAGRKIRGGGKGAIIGSALGAAAGAFGGRGAAETAATGSFKEGFLEPEVNDYVDSLIAGLTAGAGSSTAALKPVIISLAGDLARKAGLKSITKEVAEQAVKQTVSKSTKNVAKDVGEGLLSGATKATKPKPTGLLGPSGRPLQ